MYKVFVSSKLCADFACSYSAADLSHLRTCVLDALMLFNLDNVHIHIGKVNDKENEKKK